MEYTGTVGARIRDDSESRQGQNLWLYDTKIEKTVDGNETNKKVTVYVLGEKSSTLIILRTPTLDKV